MFFPKFVPRCATIATYTQERCPNEGTERIDEETFLCKQCHITWLAMKVKKESLKNKIENLKR